MRKKVSSGTDMMAITRNMILRAFKAPPRPWSGPSRRVCCGRWVPTVYLTRFHGEFDRGPLFAVDHDVRESGYAHQVDTARRHEAPGDGDGFDSLVEGTRSDDLYLRVSRLA